MAMPSMAMMRRPRPGSSAVADPHAAPDSANARNRSPQPVPFTFAAWIALGPQQVGFSVIPPGLVIPPPTTSFPRRQESLQAKSCFVHGLHGHSHTHLVIPVPTRHSREGRNLPMRRAALCTGCMVIPTPTSSFPYPPVIPVPTTSFPRRRESPVALLDAPLGESPSPAVIPQKETVSRNLESPRVPCPVTHRTDASPAPRSARQSQSCSIRPYPPPACAQCLARNRGRIPGPDACS